MMLHRRSLLVPIPRLLPVTIGMMLLLLFVKSGSLVLAATSGSPPGPAPDSATRSENPAKSTNIQHTSASDLTRPPAAPLPVTNNAAPKLPWQNGIDPNTTGTVDAGLSSGNQSVAAPESDKELALLTDLRRRREAIDRQEALLSARTLTLTAVEKRLDERISELKSLQVGLEGLEVKRKQHDDANWGGLVKLYEAMKPREAASIFNDLELPVLLPVLDRMKEGKAAQILAAMIPERARQVTEALAQQRTKDNTALSSPDGASNESTLLSSARREGG